MAIVGSLESGPLVGVVAVVEEVLVAVVDGLALAIFSSVLFSLPTVIVLELPDPPQPAIRAAAPSAARPAPSRAPAPFSREAPFSLDGTFSDWSRPGSLTQLRGLRVGSGAIASVVDRARRGRSGALNPQSALAGLNSPQRGLRPGSPRRMGRRWLGSRAVSAREPGQVRKEAALPANPGRRERGLPDPESQTATGARRAELRRGVHGPSAARSSAPQRVAARTASRSLRSSV